MAEPATRTPPFRGYDDPLDLVDRTEIAYEERLALLQEWQASLADDDEPARETVTGAIQALEMGAAVQKDEPETVPEGRGYGVHRDE